MGWREEDEGQLYSRVRRRGGRREEYWWGVERSVGSGGVNREEWREEAKG